jgi:Reverse transcriptase (RNA-dependent DNA polymerase)
MNIEDIIERGYFPKELPPPFNTRDYAKHISPILTDWHTIFENNTNRTSATFVLTQSVGENPTDFNKRKKAHERNFIARYNTSAEASYSISKGRFSRRFLGIPNPNHFSLLSEKIVDLWIEFEKAFALSEYSRSYPVPEASKINRSVSTISRSVLVFRDHLLHASSNKRIQVKIDISKFYPTIYTHSIGWALLGKEKARTYFLKTKEERKALIAAGDVDAILYQNAENIDTALRACQRKQSVGIPIGPDTSHIISEAIACRLDSIIKERFADIDLKACRYYDDYYLFVSTNDEADKVLKGIQLILNTFELEINESKVSIKQFPFAIEDAFTTKLFMFEFKKGSPAISLRHYFSLIWEMAENDRKHSDTLFKYSLRVFERRTIQISKSDWKLFEELLFKTALMEPSVLDIVTRILLTYRSFIDAKSKEKLTELIKTILIEHTPINHNFEISWALWIAKTFGIEINEECADKVLETGDNIAILILLDLINNTTLVSGHPNVTVIESTLTADALFSDQWLLAYEGVKKGWLVSPSPNLLQNNDFFKLLEDRDIEFYDKDSQLSEFPVKPVISKTDSHPPYELTYEAMMMDIIGLPSNFI